MCDGVELFYSPSLKDLKTVFNKYFWYVQVYEINQIFIASIAYYASHLYNSLLPFCLLISRDPCCTNTKKRTQELFAKLICYKGVNMSERLMGLWIMPFA